MAENNSSDSASRKYVYSPSAELYALAEIPPNAPRNPIIKWYQTNMSYEDKYRFGHMTYEEYCAWMYELMAEAQRAQNNQGAPASEASSSSEGSTFWHADQEARTNISSNDYNDFLKNNSVDISNRSTVDFDKLASEINSEAAPPAEAAPPPSETNLDEVLANVSKDIHGGDQMLTQEEIEALFAAANGG